jgi:plasmid replication initiation protein
MPKRKKLPVVPDYIGLGDVEKLTTQKSTPLQSLTQTDLTLPELKILDVYLSRIDSHDPEKRTVQIEKGELERVLRVTRILKDDLDKRLRHLFQAVEVKDKTKRKGFKIISLFEEADAEPDENDLWTITLTCTLPAREYIFNIENLGYLRYRLKNIIELKSRYSYILFMYLENNRGFRNSWEIKLDDLKELLKCNAETYKTFFRFNGLVLSKCHQEINEKTDCKFDYEPIKRGRAIVAIRFTLKTLKQLAVEDVANLPEVQSMPDNRPLWESALKEWKLSQEKLDELAALLDTIPKSKLPEAEDTEKSKYKYIALKAAEIKRRSKEKRISNRFAYLKKMIDADIQKVQNATDPKSNTYVPTGTQAFRNYTERDPAANAEKYRKQIYDQYKQQ